MLKRWSIENFKSFRDRTEIDLSAINIFAGANSSGKSTIIQSILVLKQTLQYAPSNRPIALNGPLLKLGTFEDVKNSTGRSPHIGISWILDVDEQSLQSVRSAGDSVPLYFGRISFNTISGEFRWDIAPDAKPSAENKIAAGEELRQLQPNLSYASVQAKRTEGDNPRTASVTMRRATHTAQEKRIQYGFSETAVGVPEAMLSFEISHVDPITKDELLESKADAQIVGGAPSHFLPLQVCICYDANKERARQIAAAICGDIPDHRIPGQLARVKIPKEVADLISKHVEEINSGVQDSLFPEPEEGEMELQEMISRLRRRRNASRHRLRSATAVLTEPTPAFNLSDLRPTIAEMLEKRGSPVIELELNYARPILEAYQYARNYFLSSVRYLGPLRDEPRPIYPLEALVNPTDVGFKGEHTAAVLDLHRDTTIEYLPSSFVEAINDAPSLKSLSLHDAVVDWLSYVGVAEEVTTSNSGKFGHQLRVRTQGTSRFHDLTNVGVGVSQVLPIIVMALLANKTSLLIFEQPELHLHPKVQARLADFFLSVALSGKQCLLETHSEYLIERFRRRVAKSSNESFKELLKIYFTDRRGGATECRSINVSKYGAIAEWPDDFFDQSQIETEHILQAASAKRAAERANKS